MKVIQRFVLKSGGEAKGAAKVAAGSEGNYVEAVCALPFDAVVATSGNEAIEVRDGKPLPVGVDGVALYLGQELVASGGARAGYAPAYEGKTPSATEENASGTAAASENFGKTKESGAAASGGEKPQTASAESDEGRNIPQTSETTGGETKEGGFFKLIEPKLTELFEGRERVSGLEAVFPDSKWVSVDDGDEPAYVVGVVGKPVQFICYGVPDADGSAPPKGREECRQWLPLPGGGGYWMMYQSADDGSTLTAL